MRELLDALVASWPYWAVMTFLGTYPLITSIYWSVGSYLYSRRREREDGDFYDIDEQPFVSVLVAARNEELVLERTIRALLHLDWPGFEVLVVDDGSTDSTPDILRAYADLGLVRVLRKERAEGKAMALNDALPLVRGEIVLVVDADGRPNPDALRWMVPHFVRSPRVAAVTANPRVANTTTLLAKLQALEFSATVSVLRRAQATYGRLTTFSGICTALRRSAVESVGRFQADMATEDIALSWQLQRAHWQVRYEPRALFAMQVPETLNVWWRQRSRWARGLTQVLRRHAGIFRSWQQRRQWPVFAEAALSTAWSILFVLALGLWGVCYASGTYDFGVNPIPNFWAMLIASAGLIQVGAGILWDSRYDDGITRYIWWMPLYPLVYWLLTSLVTARAAPGGLLRRPRGGVTWHIPRVDAPPS